MSKRPSLKKQVCDVFKSLERYGESKFEAKEIAVAITKAAGTPGWNPARLSGVYSLSTMEDYLDISIRFTDWVKAEHGSRYLEEAKQFVPEYLQRAIDKNYSAWTIANFRSALRKLYQDPFLAEPLQIPIRHTDDIKRSRGPKAMDAKFSVERNRDLVDFSLACGLRRHELQELRVGDVYRDGNQLWVHVERGKGGRKREVPVLTAFQERVLEIIHGKNLDDFVIERIPVRADIHGYRREYANSLYQQIASKPYDLRDKDEIALQRVSWALGHNRLDVVTRNYLGELSATTDYGARELTQAVPFASRLANGGLPEGSFALWTPLMF
jgi:integrase